MLTVSGRDIAHGRRSRPYLGCSRRCDRARKELEELAADAGTGDAPGGSDQVVARLDPASQAREGRQLELWFDPGKLHLFNPQNGAHLTL